MVDKNLAFNRGNGSEDFADSDPLSELARIVGYEDRPRHVSPLAAQAAGAQHRSEPNFNLEDELLREFAIYDAPRDEALTPANDVAPPSADTMHVNDFLQRVEDVFARREPEFDPSPAVEAEPSSPDFYADDLQHVEAPIGDALRYTMNAQPQDFSADAYLDPYAQEPQVADPYAAVPQPRAYAPSYDEPVHGEEAYQEPIDLSYEVEQSVVEEPVYYDEPAYAPEPAAPQPEQATPRAAQGARSSLEFSSMRMPLGNFSMSRATPFIPKPGAPATVPVATQQPAAPAPVHQAYGPAAAAPIPAPYSSSAAPATSAGPKFNAQSDFDALIADVSRYSIGKAEEPPVAAPAAAAAPQSYAPHPSDPELDLSDDAFEAALDDMDFEFDLSDIDLSESPRDPVVAETVQQTDFVPEPAPRAQAAYRAPVQAQSADANSQAFSASAAQAAPQYRAPVAPPVAAPAAPVATHHAQRPVEALPFDFDQIGEAEDQPVGIAEFEVPDLPVQVNEPRPVAQRSDDDLDLDTELAALFTPQNTGLDRHRAAEKSQNAAPVGRAADVDEFERALEADFRRSLQENPTKPTKIAAVPVDEFDDYHVNGDAYDERSAAKRWLVPAAAAVGALVVLGGLYSVFFAGTSTSSDGQPVVIAADDEPMKVLPDNPGGRVVPNQDQAVYDRVAGGAPSDPRQPALISTDESPVDVVQRTLIPEQLGVVDDGEFASDGAVEDNALDTVDPRLLPQENEVAAGSDAANQTPVNVAPRRVRTMIVKPDGTLVTQEVEAPPAVATPAAPAPSAPAVVAQAPAPAPAAPALAPTPVAAPAAPVAATPAPAPVEAPVVAAAPPALAPVTPAASAVANTTSSGGFYMQIASLPSEAEAQKAFQTMSSKFGSVIGGRGVDIKRAEIAGKGTYFRVRIPAGNRSEAVALCERFRAAGGSCLVAR